MISCLIIPLSSLFSGWDNQLSLLAFGHWASATAEEARIPVHGTTKKQKDLMVCILNLEKTSVF